MAKEVVVVTTKPELDQVEYAIRENGVMLRHGELVNFDPDNLTAPQAAQIDGTRALLLALATADATAKGLL